MKDKMDSLRGKSESTSAENGTSKNNFERWQLQ